MKDWAVYGDARSRHNLVSSIFMDPVTIQEHNRKLEAKYLRMAQEIVDYEAFLLDDAEFAFVAYGICARICKSSARILRSKGIRAGVLRPKTLFPFPAGAAAFAGGRGCQRIVTVELSSGQMFEDVRLAVGERVPTSLYSWSGRGGADGGRNRGTAAKRRFTNPKAYAHHQAREAKDVLRAV